jgi:hypothetical protein
MLAFFFAPSPGLAFGQAGLSHEGRGSWFHSAKWLPKKFSKQYQSG